MKRTILLLVGFFFVWQFGFAQKAVIIGIIILIVKIKERISKR